MVKRFKRFLAMACTAAMFIGTVNIPVCAAAANGKNNTKASSSQSAEIKEYNGIERSGVACYKIDEMIDEPEAPTYEEFVEGVKKENQSAEASTVKGVYKDIVTNRDWYSYGSKYIYNQLTANEKKLYNNMYSYCLYFLTNTNSDNKIATNYKISTMKINGKVKKDYITSAFNYSSLGLSFARAFQIFNIFCYENPQFYFVSPNIYYDSKAINLSFFGKFKSSVSRAKTTNSIFTTVDNYAQQVRSMPNDEQKARKAEELIMARNKYAYSKDIPGKNFTEFYDQSIFSTFSLGYTVCAGYTKGVMAVLRKAGMSCMAVTSKNHAWNLVKINGKWYNLDATWDDEDSGVFLKTFFLKSDEYLNVNDRTDGMGNPCHTRSPEWNIGPSCMADYGQAWPAAYANINSKVDSAESKNSAFKSKLSKVYVPTLFSTTIKVKLSKSIFLYDGKEKKPTVNVSIKGNVLSPVQYTVTYAKGRKNPGVYKVTVTLNSLSGYKATKTVKYSIIPLKNKLTKVSNAAGGVLVKWKKGKGNITGYQIQVSPVKNFSKDVKSKKIKKVGKLSTKLVTLESGKRYYVRIRTFKENASGVAYSNWSAVRSIKVK